MTVREAIALEMKKLSKIKNTVFLGENIINSGRIYGTLNEVPIKSCLEMPVAENLIAGTALGLAIAGYIPVCIFQRMDFMLIAADSIINHACMFPRMSGGSVGCGIIFRTIKANLNDRFYVGHQHSKDLSHVFEPYLPTLQFKGSETYRIALGRAREGEPTLVVEDYENFNQPLK